VPIDGIETDAAYGARDGVKRAAHVEGLNRHDHPHRGRQAQHDRRASSTRRSVATENSTRTVAAGISSTSAWAAAEMGSPQPRRVHLALYPIR
jgi:hypothetical protein